MRIQTSIKGRPPSRPIVQRFPRSTFPSRKQVGCAGGAPSPRVPCGGSPVLLPPFAKLPARPVRPACGKFRCEPKILIRRGGGTMPRITLNALIAPAAVLAIVAACLQPSRRVRRRENCGNEGRRSDIDDLSARGGGVGPRRRDRPRLRRVGKTDAVLCVDAGAQRLHRRDVRSAGPWAQSQTALWRPAGHQRRDSRFGRRCRRCGGGGARSRRRTSGGAGPLDVVGHCRPIRRAIPRCFRHNRRLDVLAGGDGGGSARSAGD